MDHELPKLQLTGANGNVFNVISLARRAMRKAGYDEIRITNLVNQMMGSESYEAVITLCLEHFDVS